MNLKARIKKASEELATIPRVRPHGRDTDSRVFEAYIKHCVVAGNLEPPGALEFALQYLPQDEGPLSPAMKDLVKETVGSAAQPGEMKKPPRITGAQRMALSRWYACLIKGIPVPELLQKQLWPKPGHKVKDAGSAGEEEKT